MRKFPQWLGVKPRPSGRWGGGVSQLFSSAFHCPPSFPPSCWMQRLQRVPFKAPQGTESLAVLRNDTQRQKEKRKCHSVTLQGLGTHQPWGSSTCCGGS